jgi:hypothetical protein
MAMGLRHDPYMQPKEFMDDILGMMKESFSEHVAEVRQEIAGKLAEVDAAVAAMRSDKAREVRLECARIAAEHVPSSAQDIRRIEYAASLAQYVLTGKKPGVA